MYYTCITSTLIVYIAYKYDTIVECMYTVGEAVAERSVRAAREQCDSAVGDGRRGRRRAGQRAEARQQVGQQRLHVAQALEQTRQQLAIHVRVLVQLRGAHCFCSSSELYIFILFFILHVRFHGSEIKFRFI